MSKTTKVLVKFIITDKLPVLAKVLKCSVSALLKK